MGGKIWGASIVRGGGGRGGSWRGQDEGFWRAHQEAWKRSDLNQRQYCEAEGIPLKAFGNWRAQFKAEPQPHSPVRRSPLRTPCHDTAPSKREGAFGPGLRRYAQGHRRARHAGAGLAAAGSVHRPPVRVPGPHQGQPYQNRILGWHGALSVHQAARVRRLPVATERRTRRDTIANLGTTVVADRWRGLARAGTALATGDSGITAAAV